MGRKVGKIKVFLSFLQDVHKDSRKGYFFLLRDFIRLKKEKGIRKEPDKCQETNNQKQA